MSAVSASLPTVVIGGYLGAGKTTLVNHLLRHAAGRRIAVLVNDFGDIDIDAELIESAADGNSAGVLSLSGGCLCCSFGDDLVGTLVALGRRDPAPDVVLIELSGVALPAAVVRTARLAPCVEWVGTLVVADAAELRRQASDRYVGDTVMQQLRQADWVLLNKLDLVEPAALQATANWLAGAAAQPRVLAVAATEVEAELVLGWRAEPQVSAEDSRHAIAGFARRPMARADRPAVDSFASANLRLPDGIDLAALAERIAAPEHGVLRAKALAVDCNGAGQLLQLAGGRWTVTPAAVQGPGRLVLIGLRGQLDTVALARLLAETG